MKDARMGLKRCVSGIALFSALLLTCTMWIVGVHHHDPSDSRPCAVCTAGHAPATVSISSTTVSAPRPVTVRVIERISAVSTGIAPGIAPSRAPPIS